MATSTQIGMGGGGRGGGGYGGGRPMDSGLNPLQQQVCVLCLFLHWSLVASSHMVKIYFVKCSTVVNSGHYI